MVLRPSDDFVSTETIRRRRNELDRYELIARTRGNLAADSEWGKRMPGPFIPMPNFRWEIDSTRIDLWVIDPVTRKLFPYRPTLYVVFDCFIRGPVGLHLDIHPPSTNGFLAAIRNAILPKTYVRKLFPSVKTEWLPCGYPVEVFTDNGSETWSLHTQVSLAALELGISYLPPYVPRYKAGVERFFRTLNQLLFHKIHGTTLGKKLPKRELDPKRDAILTLAELAELLHVVIVDEVMNMPMSRGRFTRNVKFLRALEIHDIELPTDMLSFDLAFARPDVRTLRQTGIHFGDIVYQNDATSLLYGRLGHGKDVAVRRPADQRSIYVLNPMTGDPFEVPAVTKNVAEPLPYATLVPFTEEDLGLQPADDGEEIVKGARSRKQEVIDAAVLRAAARHPGEAPPRATYGKAPAFQDIAAAPHSPIEPRKPTDDALAERLRRRLRGEPT